MAKNINQNGRSTVLVGSSTPGQYEACPEFRYFTGVHYLALVCGDDELAVRLRQRPSHRRSSSPQFISTMQDYNCWFKEKATTITPNITLLDTTHMTVIESVVSVKKWLAGFTDLNS